MGQYGFGHAVTRQRPQTIGATASGQSLPRLLPGPNWSGIEASGFSSFPTDPERLTAKPGLRLIVPPAQHFTNRLVVGVAAFANNEGSLIGGIERVRFHFEGNAIDIFGPSTQSFLRRDGTPYNCLGYWVELRKPIGINGHANLYVEAFPADPTMQRRVIGPYRYSPVTTLHDFDLTVTPSQAASATNYQTVTDALDFLKTQSANNPRIRITEPHPSGFYGLPQSGTVYSGGKGRCLIEATTPVTFGNPTYTSDSAATMRPRYDGLHFKGENITFDLRYVAQIVDEELGELPWFDRVRFTISGAGRGEYWRKGTRPLPWIARHGGWWTECAFDNVKEPVIFSPLARGCIMHEGYGDVATDALCVVSNRIDDWDSSLLWQVDAPALTVNGPAGATLSLIGANDADGRLFTAKENGTTIGTFEVGRGESYFNGASGDGYTVSDVSNWLNSLPGWSATVIDDTRRASAMAVSGTKGASFSDIDVSLGASFVTYFDLHTDWYSQNQDGPEENVISFGNTTSGFKGQSIFITADKGAKDFFFVNDAFDNRPDLNLSQLEGAHSHVVLAHVSSTTQNLLLRVQTDYDPDSYCLIANCAFPAISWSASGTPDPDLTITNNVLDAGSTIPQFAVGTVAIGTPSSKFADAVTGDFAPAADLLANPLASAAQFDGLARARGALEPAGAFGLGTAEAPAFPEPSVPQPETTSLQFASVRFPAENGENSTGENGGFYLPASYELLRTNTAGDTPLLSSTGSVAVLWKVPRDIYNGLKRNPVILGNDRTGASVSAANQFRLTFITGADNSNTANVGKFRLFAQGETANGNVDVYSAALPPANSDWVLIKIRVTGTNIAIDLIDLQSGTVTTGPTVALPTGWLGISSFARDLGLGVFRPTDFPQDHSDLFGNTGYARGEFGGLLFLETDGTIAEWDDFALGGDPLTIWPDQVRAWFPLTDGNSLDLSLRTNLTVPTAYTADLVTLGSVYPGSTARRQDKAKFLIVKDVPDPALVPVYSATMRGDFRFTLVMGGQTPGEEVRARFLYPDGKIAVDWATIGTSVADGEVDVVADLVPGIYRAEFRLGAGGDVAVLNSDIVVGPGILVNGQSQCDFAFGLSLDEVDDAAMPFALDFASGVGPRTFVLARSRVAGGHPQLTATYRAAEKPGIIGPGFVAASNKLAESLPSTWPIILIDTSVSGTSIRDTLEDDSTPDDRDMADIYAITDTLRGRDAQGRSVVTAWVQFWHSSGSVQAYAQSFMPPMLDGTPTAQVPVVDDWFKSGIAINPNFPLIHLEPNRIVNTTATSEPTSVEDTRSEHLTRKNLRDEEVNFAYTLGAPIDVQHLQQDVFTHPDPTVRYGSAFVAETVMQSVKPAIGRAGGYAGPVELTSAAFIDESNNIIDVNFEGPLGFSLGVLNGGSVSGFEVGNDRSGFAATIISSNTIRLIKNAGSWNTGVAIELKPGGPGNYGSGHDEDGFVNGALINTSDGCLVRGTGIAIATSGGSTGGGSGNPQADLIAAMNAGGGTNAFHDYSTATGSGTTSWISSDLTVNGSNHTQTAFGFRSPGPNGEFDGTTLAIQSIPSGGTFTIVMSATKDDASTSGHLIGTNGTSIQYLQGSVIPLAFTTLVNGTAITTQGALYTTLHQAGEVALEIRDINRTAQTELHIGRGSSSLVGNIRKVAVIDQASITDLVQARLNAVDAVMT